MIQIFDSFLFIYFFSFCFVINPFRTLYCLFNFLFPLIVIADFPSRNSNYFLYCVEDLKEMLIIVSPGNRIFDDYVSFERFTKCLENDCIIRKGEFSGAEDGQGNWSVPGIQYETRTLFFKALHNLIER